MKVCSLLNLRQPQPSAQVEDPVQVLAALHLKGLLLHPQLLFHDSELAYSESPTFFRLLESRLISFSFSSILLRNSAIR